MAKPVLPREFFQDLSFPKNGIDNSCAYGAQRKGTTPQGQNVRAFDQQTNRMRGGSRSGLTKYVGAQVNSTALIQDLALLPYISAPAIGTGGSTKTDVIAVAFSVRTGFSQLPFSNTNLNGNALDNFPSILEYFGYGYVGCDATSSDAPATRTAADLAFRAQGFVNPVFYKTIPTSYFISGVNTFALGQGPTGWGRGIDAFFLQIGVIGLSWNGTSWAYSGYNNVVEQFLKGSWSSTSINFTL